MNETRRRTLSLLAISLGWLLSAVDIVLLILFQRDVAQALDVPLQQVRIAIGVGLLGSAIGGIFFAQLGDQIGRVRALSISVIVYSLATAAMGMVDGLLGLFAFRFLAGVGTGGEWSIGFALLSEVERQTHRGRSGGWVAGMFNLGTFIAILLFQSGLGWRMSFGLMFTPALLALTLRHWLPESDTWVALKDAQAKEEDTAQTSPLADVLRPPFLRLSLKVFALFALMNIGFYSFSTLFINYLQAPLIDGGLALSVREQLPFQIALNVSSLLSVISAGILSDYLGRKRSLFIFCMVGATAFLGLFLYLNQVQTPSMNTLITIFSVCCMGFGVNGILGVFTPELYPTRLRSSGPGLCQNWGKGIGGLAGVPAAGAALPVLGYSTVLAAPFIVFIGMAVIIWRLPEVGGRALHALEDTEHLTGSLELK